MVRILNGSTLASATLLILAMMSSTITAREVEGLTRAKTCRNPDSDCCNFQNTVKQHADEWHAESTGWFWDSMVTKRGHPSPPSHDVPKNPIVALTFNPTETWTDAQEGRFWGPGGLTGRKKKRQDDTHNLYRRVRVQVPGATRDITLNCQDPDSFQCYSLASLGEPFKHLTKPLEIHPGNYCTRVMGTAGDVWDNLWVRYDGVMKNAPTSCKPWQLPQYDAPLDQIWARMCFFE